MQSSHALSRAGLSQSKAWVDSKAKLPEQGGGNAHSMSKLHAQFPSWHRWCKAQSLCCNPAVQSTDKQLCLVNHMWHVLGKEPGNDKVLADIIDWVLARA